MDGLGAVDRLREEILAGVLSRRAVLKRAVALGLSAPVVAGLLAACGDDDDDDTTEPTATAGSTGATATTGGTGAASPTAATGTDATATTGRAAEPTATTSQAAQPTATTAAGTQAGGGGLLRLLWWQAPTILNPHLSTGTKDFDASRVVYEPLADFDADGNMILSLAAEEPSVANGMVSENGTSVTWKLREGVVWHDGEEFTADDVVFTWEYASNEATAAVTIGNFATVESVTAEDDYTVSITFTQPNPAWFDVFTGPNGMILPRHVFEEFVGETSRDAPANLMPVGTGPFKVREFRPADVVLYDIHTEYWDAGKPFFDEVEMKGGGDAQAAARAVMETDEADWSWNVQVEPQILQAMYSGGAGDVLSNPGTNVERIMVNFADPNQEVDGARSEPSTAHPIFQHKEARNAIALAIQRDVIAEQLYGAGGVATSNNLNAPGKFASPNTSWKYDLAAAKALLDSVGFSGGSLLYQTSVNSVRQKTQEIVKQDLEKLGFTVELKSVDAAVFFSSDAGNPDTYPHFYADLEMYTNGPDSPYPITWAERYRSDEIASKANQWSGTNITRYNNPEFDKLHDQARVEIDPDKQVELFVAMNDLSVNDFVEIPQVYRANVACVGVDIKGYAPTSWSSDVYDIKNWTREG
jgi:peptide/nickel transport system substrate-binding protein